MQTDPTAAPGEPVAPSKPTAPTVADPLLWGPYLRRVATEGTDADFADALGAARRLFMVELEGAVPHGTYARVARWAFTGADPGEPACTCGCVARVPVA